LSAPQSWFSPIARKNLAAASEQNRLRSAFQASCEDGLEMNHGEIVSFIWGVADLIRDTFKRGSTKEYIRTRFPTAAAPASASRS